MQDHEHPEPTKRSGYRYLFTAKHHGGGATTDSMWLPGLSEDDEFSVFDNADERELLDEDGNLYGAARDGLEGLRYLGTWGQQVAKYPRPSQGSPWHGYPLWPLNEDFAPANRKNAKFGPPAETLERMVRTGLISKSMKKRIRKGDHV